MRNLPDQSGPAVIRRDNEGVIFIASFTLEISNLPEGEPLLVAGLMFGLLIVARHDMPLAILFVLLGSGSFYAYYPAFWAIPMMMLGETAAAATFALMNSIGQRGGLAGPYAIGFLNVRTHSLAAALGSSHSSI